MFLVVLPWRPIRVTQARNNWSRFTPGLPDLGYGIVSVRSPRLWMGSWPRSHGWQRMNFGSIIEAVSPNQF